MAFATSSVSRDSTGSSNVFRGTWTGAAGDSTVGTVTGSGYALMAQFLTNNSTGPENAIPVRITNSSNTWTVSVPYNTAVTAGTFRVEFK